MNHVFVVVATRDSEIEVCETFSGLAALGRAFQLASDKSGRGRIDLFNVSPAEEVLADGSKRWVFMDTIRQSVVVFYREVVDALLDSRDPNNLAVGLSSTKNVSKDIIPSGPMKLPAGFGFYQSDDSLLTYPPRGILEHPSVFDGYQSLLYPRGLQPPVTEDEIVYAKTLLPDIEEYFSNKALEAKLAKKINAIEYIGDGLPYGAGGNLAKALLDMGMSREWWDDLVIDLHKLPADMLISAFFNSFLQRIADADQGYCESVRKTVWLTSYDFQKENIARWMEDFKPLPPPYDFMDRTLPAGWDINGKPILMGDFLDNPAYAKDPARELTIHQQWALIEARIRRSPHYCTIPKGYSGWVCQHDEALKSVEDKDSLGVLIRDGEMESLADLRKEIMAGTLKV